MYGNPETHKLKCNTNKLTLHSLVSSIDTYNYKLTKSLIELLNPVIPTQYCTPDYFSFGEEIQDVNDFNKFIISYTVCSLFTNIPPYSKRNH